MPPLPDPEGTTFSQLPPTSSFEEVFRATYAELRDFVATYVHSRDIAHELVQDLFLRVWEMRDSANPPPLTRAYLFSAARNRALRYLRHRRVEQRWEANLAHEREVEPTPSNTQGTAEYAELAEAARRAIDELPERCRQVFLLSRQQQLRYQEIAQVLGISVSTVETQMWRALKALRAKLAPFLVVIFALMMTLSVATAQSPSTDTLIAIVNTTLIDGNGGPPAPHTTVVIAHGRIVAVGPAAQAVIPKNAYTIDGTHLWAIPGLINTNVFFTYVSCPGVDSTNRFLSAAGCAQRHLRNGETTVMDSHGFLDLLTRLRDMINRGEILGSRLVVAGNILGFGPGCSFTGSLWPLGDTCHDSVATSTMNPKIRATVDSLLGPPGHATGDELVTLPLDSLQGRINAYLDRGSDFIKYLATPHQTRDESRPVFSRQQQEIIVATAHRRGKFVSTHCSTVERMRECALAGVDMFQHASGVDSMIPDDLAALLGKNHTVCSISDPAFWRNNFIALWKGGCTISLETDENSLLFPIIESAVEAGMTPLEAITAATKNGAIAAHLSKEIGTVEQGKVADVVLLSADPTVDISNIRQIELVIARGRLVPKTSDAEDRNPVPAPGP